VFVVPVVTFNVPDMLNVLVLFPPPIVDPDKVSEAILNEVFELVVHVPPEKVTFPKDFVPELLVLETAPLMLVALLTVKLTPCRVSVEPDAMFNVAHAAFALTVTVRLP
jgi:hypothetical protein